MATAKIAGIEMCWSYNRQYNKNSTKYYAVMPTNLYGPNDHYGILDNHVPALLRKFHIAKIRKSPQVTVLHKMYLESFYFLRMLQMHAFT